MLKDVIKRRLDQSIGNTQTSVAAEVADAPIRMPDGTYQVSVEMIGGAYGGRATMVAVFTETLSGVTGNSLKRGDLVMISFDEKGYSAPRITSIISRETAMRNVNIRNRPAVSDSTRTEPTSMLSV